MSVPPPAGPVQRSRRGHASMELLEVAYRDYGRHYSQSLERINQRGGFAWSEIAYQLFAEIVRIEQGDAAARELNLRDHVAEDGER